MDDSDLFQLRLIIRTVLMTSIPSLTLFVVSWRWDWLLGWAYIGLSMILSSLTQLVMAWKRPELWVERVTSLSKENSKPWDRWLVPFINIFGPLLTMVAAGLDIRFGWSGKLPLVVHLGGLGCILLGYALSTWALFSNPFFSGVVRIQHERGHKVITSGPYRSIRHPGYAGNLVYYLGLPFFLGTLWAYLPVSLLVLVTIGRTALEDHTLQVELEGYRAYTQRVRYRLVPGIW